MESDPGKLFVGGISWDTDEDRLREYFSKFGEVVEAVIMRDRNTNRARGFGFVVYADPLVAGRVVKEKHVIDGRTVEAKKAVPRDDKSTPSRNDSVQGSPGSNRSKKIFVGGLASTVNETDFKTYFEQFGNITDVVVMYDHNTKRPRGFGFITFDSEDAVDKALHKTFHELNGKMVEVKRAVPKELSPGTGGSPLIGYNFGFNRASNYPQGYNLGSLGGYGVSVDDRLNLIASGRSGFSQFGSLAYGLGMNFEPASSPSFGRGSNFRTDVGYGRVLSPYFGGSPNRYNTPIGYNTSSSRGDSFLGSSNLNLFGNVDLNNTLNSSNTASYIGSGSGGAGFGVFGMNGPNWGSSVSTPIGSGNVFRGRDNGFGLGSRGIGRSNSTGVAANSSFASSSDSYDGSYGDLYRSRSVYGDPTWQSASSDVAGSGSFGYRLGNSSDMPPNDSEGYVGGYTIANRQSNTGIPA